MGWMTHATDFFTQVEGSEPDQMTFIGVIPEDGPAKFILFEAQIFKVDGNAMSSGNDGVIKKIVIEISPDNLGTRFVTPEELEVIQAQR